jgi:TonB family protein
MSGIEGLLAGRVLAERYYIERVIGRGGMGAVYAAVDQRLGRPVAVKVMILPAGDPDTRERVRQRFTREAQAAARLRHPNIVTVHDFGTDDVLGLDYLVMELLEGEDLAAHVSRLGPPAPAEALSILVQAARGLAAGHRGGMVHRDVKPGNIFLEVGEHGGIEARVLDFGIAQVAFDDLTLTHLTVAGRGPLSPAYASPEQLAGERRLSPASDVFSLGAVALFLLTGERPFGSAEGRPAEEVDAALARLDGRTDVPDALRDVLRRALAPEPGDRFPDAGSFREALDAIALGDEAQAREIARSTTLATIAPAAVAEVERRGDDALIATPVRAPAEYDDRTEFAPAAALPGVDPVAAASRAPTTAIPPSPARRRSWVGPLAAVAVLAAGGAAVVLHPWDPSPSTPGMAPVDSARADTGAATTVDTTRVSAARADSVLRDSIARAEKALAAARDSIRSDSVARAESERHAAFAAESARLAANPPDGIFEPAQLTVQPVLRNRDDIQGQLSRRYPDRQREAGIAGRVSLQFVIDERGRVDRGSIAVLSATDPAFVDPTVEVVRRMRFLPGQRNGVSVRTRYSIPINWQPAPSQ